MPKLSARFGPIPQTVVLDGSGNGSIGFQPNGSNARITTLYVKVDTTVSQAAVTLYKGQVADSNIIGNTNSGSTGAPAFGNIDLVDGETLYVVWTGGDAGSTATATFSGVTIPFDEVGEVSLRWSDPIAAGDGSLIFPALKSPNFVDGVSGWFLDREGNAEFNDVVIRGDFEVNGDNGAYIRIFNNVGQPTITLKPDAFTSPGVGSISPAVILAVSDDSGDTSRASLSLSSPQFLNPGYDSAEIRLRGERWDLSEGPTILMTGDVSMTGTLNILGAASFSDTVSIGGMDSIKRRVHGTTVTASSAAIGNLETVVITIPSFTYTAGRAYQLEFSSLFNVSVASSRPQWRHRYPNLAGTQLKIAPTGAVSTGQEIAEWTSKFVVSGGVDVTTAMVITTIGSAAFTTQLLASAAQPAQVDIYDIGLATDNPNTPSI